MIPIYSNHRSGGTENKIFVYTSKFGFVNDFIYKYVSTASRSVVDGENHLRLQNLAAEFNI